MAPKAPRPSPKEIELLRGDQTLPIGKKLDARKPQDDDWDEPRTQVTKPKPGFKPTPTRAHVLTRVEGPGEPSRVVLDKDLLAIGRALSNDIRLDNEGVSRNHARLVRLDDEFTVEDLESRNGIYVNGLQVHSAILRDGDEVQIGDFIFAYQEGL
jgi:hypothetical protein